MNLSKNITLEELLHDQDSILSITPQQEFCMRVLANELLQPIRDKFGVIQITSGLRTNKTIQRLIKEGYPASKSSDHVAWSSDNPYGTGAADITLPKFSKINVVFEWIIVNLKGRFKQIILYPDKNMIHVANAWENIFKSPNPQSKINEILTKGSEGFYPYPYKIN